MLGVAAEGRIDILLRDLAKPYAMSLVEHLAQAPQASPRIVAGGSDFLSVARGRPLSPYGSVLQLKSSSLPR